MSVIFAKTPRGAEEMTQRSGALPPRVRRVLIFVDGRRDVAELRAMTGADDLSHTLGRLEEEGYIALAAVRDAAGTARATAPGQRLPSITAFRALDEEAGDPQDLAKARNFMSNTINVLVGALGTSSLLERIEQARTHAELRALFDEWYHAIVASRDGRREAEALRAKLLDVI